jgi:hypothetical protein
LYAPVPPDNGDAASMLRRSASRVRPPFDPETNVIGSLVLEFE